MLGYPERYKIPNNMMYNTPYHLTKEGVDLRTQRLIEDLSQAINKNQPWLWWNSQAFWELEKNLHNNQ